jgi:hypothetical protein
MILMKKKRVPLKARDFSEAYDEFIREVERIVKNESKNA